MCASLHSDRWVLSRAHFRNMATSKLRGDSPDDVAEASEESFPASDPPAFVRTTGSKVIPKDKKDKKATNDAAGTDDRRDDGGGTRGRS
jgi:hypothetical protein